jgi:hypothetical protein
MYAVLYHHEPTKFNTRRRCVLKGVTNENGGGSERSQMLGIGLGPW